MRDGVALPALQALPTPTALGRAQQRTVQVLMLRTTRCSSSIAAQAQQAQAAGPQRRQRAVPAQVALVVVQAQVRARQPAAEPQVERSARYCPSCLRSSLRRVQN